MMIKERPILFSTPMVQAILNGTKTQTRRSVKGLVLDQDSGYAFLNYKHQMDIHRWKDIILDFCPHGKTGDILCVRETWCYSEDEFGDHSSNTKGDVFGRFLYKANGDSPHNKWKPSIFMPKEACRIKLLIKDVRIERLHDILEEDAIEEGVSGLYYKRPKGNNDCWKNYIDGTNGFGSARESFRSLWRSINGHESWNENPYVWALTFERI